jgi:hypothetical protein
MTLFVKGCDNKTRKLSETLSLGDGNRNMLYNIQ